MGGASNFPPSEWGHDEDPILLEEPPSYGEQLKLVGIELKEMFLDDFVYYADKFETGFWKIEDALRTTVNSIWDTFKAVALGKGGES